MSNPLWHLLGAGHPLYYGGVALNRGIVKSLEELRDNLEGHFGVKVSHDKIVEASKLHNRMRALVKQVYELRQKEVPPFRGLTYEASHPPGPGSP